MYQIPPQPKIYHIIHVDRLASVVAAGGLFCDAEMQRRGPSGTTIGMSKIKRDRLFERRVKCYPDTFVGDYVPFYFCPRSVMLYIIWRANHEDLSYRGGQGPIVHLQADLAASVAWAEARGIRWAFSLSNAAARYTEFRAQLDQLSEVHWPAVATNQWSNPDVQEGKQAEFLLHSFFPWELVERVGVLSQQVGAQAVQILQAAAHRPPVVRRPDWYY